MARLSPRQSEDLQALRRAYAAQLPEKVRELAAAAQGLSEQWDAERLAGLYHLAHRLAGSSAIYGLAKTSAAARALEAFVGAALEGTVTPRGQRAARLSALVAELSEAAAERS